MIKWNTHEIIKFLTIYESYVSLWNIKHVDYLSKNKRDGDFHKLVCELKAENLVKETIEVKEVKSKIKSLKDAFRHEVSKISKSKKCGAGSGGLYKPKLAWFENGKFLMEVMSTREPSSNLEASVSSWSENDNTVDHEPETASHNFQFADTNSEMTPQEGREKRVVENKPPTESPASSKVSFRTPMKRTSPAIPSSTKKLLIKEQEDIVKTCSASLQQNGVPDEYDAIAINIAAKLRRMNSTQQLLAEGLLNKILLKGMFNELTRMTDIIEKVPNIQEQK